MRIRRDEEQEQRATKALSSFMESRSLGRTPGPHLSTIISDIARRMALVRYRNSQDQAEMYRTMVMGYVWEDMVGEYMANAHGVYLPSQFEVELDGIIGTPDSYDPTNEMLYEYKATWVSMEQDIEGERFWRWWAQMKGYCHMIGIRNSSLFVYYVNGDYKPPAPDVRIYQAEFDKEQDLIPNWNVITQHRDDMVKTSGEWWI